MPAKVERCVQTVNRRIKLGKTPKTYMKNGKRVKTNAWAICQAAVGK